MEVVVGSHVKLHYFTTLPTDLKPSYLKISMKVFWLPLAALFFWETPRNLLIYHIATRRALYPRSLPILTIAIIALLGNRDSGKHTLCFSRMTLLIFVIVLHFVCGRRRQENIKTHCQLITGVFWFNVCHLNWQKSVFTLYLYVCACWETRESVTSLATIIQRTRIFTNRFFFRNDL